VSQLNCKIKVSDAKILFTLGSCDVRSSERSGYDNSVSDWKDSVMARHSRSAPPPQTKLHLSYHFFDLGLVAQQRFATGVIAVIKRTITVPQATSQSLPAVQPFGKLSKIPNYRLV
jgi:hypothetical protein